MKNLYSRLALIASTLLVMGYLIVSAAWVPMTGSATTGTQFTATIWNNLVGNVNDLNSRIGGVVSSQWTASGTSVSYTGGSVGIGTASPDTLLHIYSNSTNPIIHLQRVGGTNNPNYIISADETLGALNFGRYGVANDMVLKNGNVGIGTTSPWSSFVVNGPATDPSGIHHSPAIASFYGRANGVDLQIGEQLSAPYGMYIQAKAESTDNAYYPIELNPLGGNVGIGTTMPNAILDVYDSASVSTRDLFFVRDYLGGASDKYRFVIRNGGNVGIGTASPIGKLDVVTTGANQVINFIATWAKTSYISIGNSATGTTGRAMIGFDNSVAIPYGYWQNASGAPLSLQSAAGNVGIGTTNPGARLHVLGTASLPVTSGSLFSGAAMFGNSGGVGVLSVGNNGDAGSWLQSTRSNDFSSNWSLLLNPNGGNVGIGTTVPFQKLSFGTTGSKIAFWELSTGNALRGIGYDATADGVWIWSIQGNTAPTTANMSLFVQGAPNGNGNVGIGTTEPGAKLAVNGTANMYTAIFQSSLTSSQAYGPIIRAGTNSTDTAFVVNDAPNINPLFRIRWDGNVGVGTINPGYKLTLQDGIFGIVDTAQGSAAAFSYSAGKLQIWLDSAGTDGIYFRTYSGGYGDRMVIKNTGSVGIGTTTPFGALQVNGNVGIFNGASGNIGGISIVPSNGDTIITNNSPGAYGDYGMHFRTMQTTGGSQYNDALYLKYNGNVGIGTISPTSKLHLINAGTSDPSLTHGAVAMFALAPGSGTELVVGGMAGNPYTAWIQHRHQTNDGSSFNLALQPSGGNVGIGTTDPGANKLYVNGTLYANVVSGGSKPFIIQDPRYGDPNRRLTHVAIEWPEAAVYYRGETKLENGEITVSLPDYFEALTRKKWRTVLLSNIDGFDRIAVKSQETLLVKDGKFIVYSDNKNSSQRFSWEVKAARSDIDPVSAETTVREGIEYNKEGGAVNLGSKLSTQPTSRAKAEVLVKPTINTGASGSIKPTMSTGNITPNITTLPESTPTPISSPVKENTSVVQAEKSFSVSWIIGVLVLLAISGGVFVRMRRR